MAADKDSKGVEGRPSRQEADWFNVSVDTAIVVGLLVICAAVYVFSADEGGRAARAQSIAPFGVALLALVTFTTVVWRGLVSTRQADEQRRQNDAKDYENLAKLLIDGTKLVSEKDPNGASMRAGLAALQAVVTATDDRFAASAMDVVLDILRKSFADGDPTESINPCRRVMSAGAQLGRSASSPLFLSSEQLSGSKWRFIEGAELHFIGGVVDRSFGLPQLKSPESFGELPSFEGTLFDGVDVDGDYLAGAEGCLFNKCRIRHVNDAFLIANRFIDCDFSNAGTGRLFWIDTAGEFTGVEEMLREGRCFYFQDKPPQPHKFVNWARCLIIRDPRRGYVYARGIRPEFQPDIFPDIRDAENEQA
ncbi:MAG: hypothetical protein H2043_14715 [Rhizobiales bacterium]|nr:hypothetical protein [Hyphomicrobiales bacterium]